MFIKNNISTLFSILIFILKSKLTIYNNIYTFLTQVEGHILGGENSRNKNDFNFYPKTFSKLLFNISFSLRKFWQLRQQILENFSACYGLQVKQKELERFQ